MTRAWIAVALLAGSWLLGVHYYEPVRPIAWAVLVLCGIAVGYGQWPSITERETEEDPKDGTGQRWLFPRGQTAAAILLFLPVVIFAPGPYRIGPLAIVAGLIIGGKGGQSPFAGTARRVLRTNGDRVPFGCLFPLRLGAAGVAAGLVLSAQGVFLAAYAAATARCHDLPPRVASGLASLASLLGVDAAADGSSLVFHTAGQAHRLAVTWDSVFDPVTGCFLVGGLMLLAVRAAAEPPVGRRWSAWLAAASQLTLIVLAWLPVRAGLLLALYVDRVARSDQSLPLHVMNQFFSPWVLLALVAVPTLLALRWVIAARSASVPPSQKDAAGGSKSVPLSLRERAGVRGTAKAPNVKRALSAAPLRTAAVSARAPLLSVALLLVGVAAVAFALEWNPAGPRKAGRVMWVERHSTWSPTTTPYDTATFGGSEQDSASYNYSVVYGYLGQFYQMSRLSERDPIDAATLAKCDVLVVKIPTDRYSEEEVEAVVQFVRAGGGLLLIGDHTNLDRSATTMNDIARWFGFTFRDDVLWSNEFVVRNDALHGSEFAIRNDALHGSEAAPDQERYVAPRVPHPAIQHVGTFDFAVSCSIDPGWSLGRPVVTGMRLWSMPAEYHSDNYMVPAEHVPAMRYGAFVQAWATGQGNGRVAAWADSTIFSNFCVYQPGKVDVMLDLVEWLNHEGRWLNPAWFVLALGAAALAVGLWLAARGGAAPLLLVAAAACGWASGSEAAAITHRCFQPLPQAVRPKLRVVLDRTTSQVPLAEGAYVEDKEGRGFGLLEQWIPRLGYTTARAAGADAFSGDALVVICPRRPPERGFCDSLARYVAEGGRLLVIDSASHAGPSTANGFLRPFDLAFSHAGTGRGRLTLGNKDTGLDVEDALAVTGGQSLATLGPGTAVAAVAVHGKGRVMAVGLGNLFNDAHMGMQWWHYPSVTEKARYQVLFALLRDVVEGNAGGRK
jgi:hypothetical protein